MSKARKFADASRISDALTLPAGNTASRPATAVAGSQRYNTDTNTIEFYTGTTWVSTNLIPTVNSVTGTIYAGAASNLTLSLSNATDLVTVRFAEGGVTISDVPNVTVTSGSATVAVPAGVYGQTAGDTIAVSVFNMDGTPSSNAVNKTVVGLPTGGTITSSGGYRYHTFTSSSNLVVPTGFSTTAEALIVAGGGGAGRNRGGGGGAGGMRVETYSLTAGTYAASLGGGGVGQSDSVDSTAGSGSSIFSITTVGGGRGGGNGMGGGSLDAGGSGGSGGAAGSGINKSGGAGTSGQGNSGGNTDATSGNGGGGGGKSASGANASSGENTTALGGAGQAWNGTTYARGGNGRSGPDFSGGGSNGAANTGNGAEGGTGNVNGGSGGSGIIIVRYTL
jgi:hypothetical protein